MKKKDGVDVKMTEQESEELDRFLTNEVNFYMMFSAILMIIALSILVMSKLNLDASSRFIYVLFRVFIVTGVLGLLGILKVFYYAFVSSLLYHGKCKYVSRKKPCFVQNIKRSELKGKKFLVVKVIGFRYAIRVTPLG